MFRSVLLASLILAASTAATSAQVVLKPLLIPGSKSRTTIEISTDQTLTLNGMALDTKVEQFLVTSEVTGRKQADGTVTSRGSFETMQVEMQLPGGLKLTFDAGSPETEAAIPQLTAILKLFDAISSSEYETTMSAPGTIDSVKITGDKYDALDDALKQEFSPEKMKQEMTQQLARLPAEAVSKGDTWKRTETMQLGGGQMFEIERSFEYLGTKNENGRELDRVSIRTDSVTYSIDPTPSFPLQLKESSLKVTDSSGEFLFDRKLGAIVKNTESFTIEGSLTLIANGAELPGSLNLTMSNTLSRE